MINNPISLPDSSIQEALKILMKYYPYNYHERAKTELDILLKHCEENTEAGSERFLSLLFIQALKNYLSPGQYLRLKIFEQYQLEQEVAFSLFYKYFPLVNLPLNFANQIIQNEIKNDTEVVLMDIGIGIGEQTARLIELLGSSTKLEKITIIGIDPHLGSLTKCQNRLIQLEARLPISIRFFPINDTAEKMSLRTIKNIIAKLNGKLIINASFSLHHIVKAKDRKTLLRSLKDMNPALFLLTEPDTNHQEKDFYRRFQNSYTHFFYIFNLIDQLPIGVEKRNSMKLYFEKEINELVASFGRDHNKRYETAPMWIDKLKVAGFEIVPLFQDLPATLEPDITLHCQKDGYLSFAYKGETLLAMIIAK